MAKLKISFPKTKPPSTYSAGPRAFSDILYRLKSQKVKTGKPKTPKVGSVRAKNK